MGRIECSLPKDTNKKMSQLQEDANLLSEGNLWIEFMDPDHFAKDRPL